MNARWLVLLLTLAGVSCQEILEEDSPSGYGAAVLRSSAWTIYNQPSTAPLGEPLNVVGGSGFLTADSGILPDSSVIGGRKLLAQRALKGVDGDGINVIINPALNVYSRVGRHCPTNPADGPYANFDKWANSTEWAMYGDLVHDNFICDVAGDGRGKVVTTSSVSGVFYGGAAQDFGTLRPLWESYGWSIFKLVNPPAESHLDHVKIQGLTLQVIGNVGSKHPAGITCGIKGVSVAIFNSEQSVQFNPTNRNYSKYIDLTRPDAETFKWTTNRTAALYVDVGVFPDAYPRFDNNTFHWLRVKLHADYGGWQGPTTGQCFAFWGVSSAYHSLNTASVKSRWQERVGGSSGYSTTCVGAATSGQIGPPSPGPVPGQHQTWWNCWNNGLNTRTGNTGRRCSTYRTTVTPPIPSQDCLLATRAQFHDYNYAFTGIQGQSGVGEELGQGGLGGAKK